jgi:ribosome-associated protein YbcJ (S4-like RNA binding protein)
MAKITFFGSEAKFLIQEGMVLVNAEIKRRRSRKIFPGEMIELCYNKAERPEV